MYIVTVHLSSSMARDADYLNTLHICGIEYCIVYFDKNSGCGIDRPVRTPKALFYMDDFIRMS